LEPGRQDVGVGWGDATVRLWDPAAGTELRVINDVFVYSLTWSPDGKSIAHGGFDGEVHVWSVPEIK
jgi:WD40 repeat protein